MSKPCISVIVPIYNTADYLPRCIESILNQTYPNLEVILVDDGSTDTSGEICAQYAKQDARIKVIRQENQGNNAARKAGIRLCAGDYITFVDSDDWIETDTVQILLQNMLQNDCDMVCGAVKLERQEAQGMALYYRKSQIASGVYETKDIVSDFVYYGDTRKNGILPYLFGKLYKTSLIKEESEKIDNHIQYSEDKALLFTCILRGISICFIEEAGYHYCVRNGSICTMEDENYLIKISYFYQYLKSLFSKQKEREILLEQLAYWLVRELKKAVNLKLGVATKSVWETYQLDPSVFFEKEKRIVLYGAGRVGKDYYLRLPHSCNIQIVAWMDRNAEKYRAEGLNVQEVNQITRLSYDYVLVAIKNQRVFEQIKEELTKLGIEQRKIVWGKPYDGDQTYDDEYIEDV